MMLFTRGIGEEILINQGDIKIKVITTINNKVVIGIQMPRQMQVDGKKAFQPMLKEKV
jgi:sRNA-binding carbon storage regulator CsrA